MTMIVDLHRIGLIANRLLLGCTYHDIGEELAISRQRVHQIARKYQLRQGERRYAKDMAKRWNCAESTVLSFIKKGIIKAGRRGKRWIILTEQNPRICRLCERPIPKGRMKYCSRLCMEVAQRESHYKSMWRRIHQRAALQMRKEDSCRKD